MVYHLVSIFYRHSERLIAEAIDWESRNLFYWLDSRIRENDKIVSRHAELVSESKEILKQVQDDDKSSEW